MLVIADSGPIISLAVINKLDLLETLYGEVYISEAVWQEISRYIEPFNIPQVRNLKGKIKTLSGPNLFAGLMDAGEAEAASLYLEINADYLIIDDRAARRTAETHGVRCLGTLAVLVKAKELNLVPALRPLFSVLLSYNRYFKKDLLNLLLADYAETPLI
jgi:predicted nucleic acid-binding protein